MKKFLIIPILLVILTSVMLISRKCFVSDVSANNLGNQNLLDDDQRKTSSQRGQNVKHSTSGQQKNSRILAMQALKNDWIKMGSGNSDLPARKKLADETVATLLCSVELLELSEFLVSEGISVGNMISLEKGARAVFHSKDAPVARDLLIEVSSIGKYSETIQDWSLYAGEACPRDDFDDFHRDLSASSPVAANMALLGRNNKLVKENPELAIKSSMDVVSNTRLGNIYIARQLENLPDNTDYYRIAKIITEAKLVNPDVLSTVNNSLFASWAQQNARKAAEFVINNPESYGPELLREIGFIGVGDISKDRIFLNEIPAGEYRDAAVQGVISKFWSDADEGELISLIDIINNVKLKSQIKSELATKNSENAGTR